MKRKWVCALALAMMSATGLNSGAGGSSSGRGQGNAVNLRQVAEFLQRAAGDINTFWASQVQNYQGPRQFRGYTGRIQTGCGESIAKNAFYCPPDHGIYYDLQWFGELHGRVGDYAPVHILAHEWGHLVQRLMGLMDPEAGLWTIETELQADCLAGMFAQYGEKKGLLEKDRDRNEAVSMLFEGGNVDIPWFDPQAHGDPGQRINAFNQGYLGRTCSGPDFFRAVGVEVGSTSRNPTPRSGSVRAGVPAQVGAFTLAEAQEFPALTQRGATESLLLIYASRDGIRVTVIIAAFPSEQGSQRLVDENLRALAAKGYRRGWQERLISPEKQPIGLVTQLLGEDEVVIWNAQHLFGYAQSANGHAKAFAEAWFTLRQR